VLRVRRRTGLVVLTTVLTVLWKSNQEAQSLSTLVRSKQQGERALQ
jgi:hypothetical protein